MKTSSNKKHPDLTLRIPPELRATVERIALENGMTVSQLVRSFIDIGISLQANEGKKK